jgi:hypothetical protein
MAGAHSVLSLLTGDSYGAIETEAAIRALEMFSAQVVPELVLPAATHCVLVHGTRRNLHLGHFFSTHGAAEAPWEVVLGSGKSASFTLPAVCVHPRPWTVIVQVGSFMALGTADGIILRVAVFSLGT